MWDESPINFVVKKPFNFYAAASECGHYHIIRAIDVEGILFQQTIVRTKIFPFQTFEPFLASVLLLVSGDF